MIVHERMWCAQGERESQCCQRNKTKPTSLSKWGGWLGDEGEKNWVAEIVSPVATWPRGSPKNCLNWDIPLCNSLWEYSFWMADGGFFFFENWGRVYLFFLKIDIGYFFFSFSWHPFVWSFFLWVDHPIKKGINSKGATNTMLTCDIDEGSLLRGGGGE